MTFAPTYLENFADSILVRCPHCAARACLLRLAGDQRSPGGYRLVCGACGKSREWLRGAPEGLPMPGAGPELRGFELSLWLQAPCCGHTLWAYNLAHLEFLSAYIGAALRGRRRDAVSGWANGSIQGRLPPWMLDAGNRAEVTACLERMKAGASKWQG